MDEQDRTEYKMQADIDLIMYIKLYIYIYSYVINEVKHLIKMSL